MRRASPFERIYFVVYRIPKGKVSTYKDVAHAAMIRDPRIVGFALHANKHADMVPCHRVVRSTGALARGYAFGGAKKQGEKLQEEGVPFLDKNRVDLAKCLAKLLPHYLPRKRSSIGQEGINL